MGGRDNLFQVLRCREGKLTDKNKVLLIIMDGWGLTPIEEGNAPLLAKTPNLDYVYNKYPKAPISASGLEVGLNRGEMGNSEVGHLNLGTGRVVWESLPRIDYAIEKGEFNDNKNLNEILQRSKGKKLHLIGLLSSGGVHSHWHHVYSLLEAAKKAKVERVYIHAMTDGRDTQPERAKAEFEEFEKRLEKLKIGKIASVIGRYYGMDRDNRWERTERAYRLIANGLGTEFSSSSEAINQNYKNKKADEFLEPAIIDKEGIVESGDGVVFFNFRADRMRQLVSAFYDHDFHHFKRVTIAPLNIIAMMKYDDKIKIPTIFNSLDIEGSLAEKISIHNFSQAHIAETEKYPHVTYFFNGGKESKFSGETRKMIPSPAVSTYDKKPEMSAEEVSVEVVKAIENGHDFVVVNFANGDMVGHTGILKAAIVACETVDKVVGKVLESASKNKYKTIITADHGNCEVMIDPVSKGECKEHSTSPVPFIFLDFEKMPYNIDVGNGEIGISREDYLLYCAESPVGVLSDVTVTVLNLMGIRKPNEMSGTNLVDAIGPIEEK